MKDAASLVLEKQYWELWEHSRLSISRCTTDLHRQTWKYKNSSWRTVNWWFISSYWVIYGSYKEAQVCENLVMNLSYPITSLSSSRLLLHVCVYCSCSSTPKYGHTIGSFLSFSFTCRLVCSKAPRERKKPVKSSSSSSGCRRTTIIRVPSITLAGVSPEQSRPSQPQASVWQLWSQMPLP